MKALLGVFGISVGESPRFYVDVFLGALSGLALLVITTLILTRQYSWQFYVAIGAFIICLCVASKRREVAAAALLIVAGRFLFAFLISFRLSALAGSLIYAIAAALLIKATRKTSSRAFFPPS
jgi:hypothetical protein